MGFGYFYSNVVPVSTVCFKIIDLPLNFVIDQAGPLVHRFSLWLSGDTIPSLMTQAFTHHYTARKKKENCEVKDWGVGKGRLEL